MERITKKQYDAIGNDYKGCYMNYDGKHPEWKGRRVAFLPGHGTTLFIEGVSFEIVEEVTPRLIILFILLLPLMVIWETAKKS